jgi:hypothetical protein
MAATTMLHVRLDERTKNDAAVALSAMGLSVCEAVRVFLHRVAAEQARSMAHARARVQGGGRSRKGPRRAQ